MSDRFEKSSVYKRLMKHAAILWGIKESEIESIDPLVKMLFGALSKEIEKVGNSISDSDSRIFRKQAQYLIPEVNQSSFPAHTVLRLFPRSSELLSTYEEFVYKKRFKNPNNFNKSEEINICYTPVSKYELSATEAFCQIQSDGIYKISGSGKEFVRTMHSLVAHNEVIIGIKCATDYPHQIQLYIDWLNESNKNLLQGQIQHIRFFLGDEELDRSVQMAPADSNIDLSEEYSTMFRIEKNCAKYYEKHFVSLDLPQTLVSAQENGVYQEFTREMGLEPLQKQLWIKLVFPPSYSESQILSSVVLDNCIPVLNRELKQAVFRLRKESNIKRLEGSGHFIEIVKAESGNGKRYRPCPSIEMAEMAKGTYNVRKGGIGRLDERDGYDYLHYMIDLLSEEKQSFAAMDASGTISELKEMEQILQRITKKLEKVPQSNHSPYIIFKPFTSSENVHVHYWITNGTLANDILTGSEFRATNPGLSHNGKVISVTSSIGGVDEVKARELIEKYKLSLMTRGTLVTKEDIQQFIKASCGENLSKLQIKNGVNISPSNEQGLVRTIDIHLQFKSGISDEQKNYWVNRLKIDLDENSSFSAPFHFVVS